MSNLLPVDPHADGVGVVGIVRLRAKLGNALEVSAAVVLLAPGDCQESVLVEALAYDIDLVRRARERAFQV